MSRRILIVVAAVFLAACGGPAPEYKGSVISAERFGGPFSLYDHNGRAVTQDTFRGKLVVMFFGYTHCPDVCPTTLSDMAQALKLLPPPVAAKVQVLFVSVDPERDTPETLKAYVPYFDSRFLGLYGTPQQVEAVASAYRVVYRKHVEPGATGYLVDHTAGSFILDEQGRLRLYLPFALPAADIAHDLAVLAKGD